MYYVCIVCMRVYLCMHLYACVWIHIGMHILPSISPWNVVAEPANGNTHTHMHACMHVFIHLCTYACISYKCVVYTSVYLYILFSILHERMLPNQRYVYVWMNFVVYKCVYVQGLGIFIWYLNTYTEYATQFRLRRIARDPTQTLNTMPKHTRIYARNQSIRVYMRLTKAYAYICA